MGNKILACIATLLLTAAAPALARQWQLPPVELSDNSVLSFTPQIALDPVGNAIALWVYGVYIQAQNYDINTGWLATPPAQLSDPAGEGYVPQISMDAFGNGMAVWGFYDGVSQYIIQARRYMASTQSWDSTTTNLSVPSTNYADQPQITLNAAGSGFAIWQRTDDAPPNNGVIQAKHYIAGSGWDATITDLSDSSANGALPQIAVDNAGHAIAVWRWLDSGSGFQVIQASYFDGTSWQVTPTTLSLDTGNSDLPQIAMNASGDAMVVWTWNDPDNGPVIQAAHYVAGFGWENPITIGFTVNLSYSPKIGIDGTGKALAVWQSDSTIWSYATFNGSWSAQADFDTGGSINTLDLAMNSKGNAFMLRVDASEGPSQVYAQQYLASSGWSPIITTLSTNPLNNPNIGLAMSTSGDAIGVWENSSPDQPIIDAARYGSQPYGLLPLCAQCTAIAQDVLYP